MRVCIPSRGPDEVLRSPIAINHRGPVEVTQIIVIHRSVPVRFGISPPTDPDGASGTARELYQQQRQSRSCSRADHCAAPGGVVWVQSMTPIGAPAGSASSATIPP